MPFINAVIGVRIEVDHIPPDVPGHQCWDGEVVQPIPGAEQVAYEFMLKLAEGRTNGAHIFLKKAAQEI